MRGGLESTAKAPARPATTLPAPDRDQVAVEAGRCPVSPREPRTVAAVWATQTNATVTAGPKRRRASAHDAEGRRNEGRPPWTAPSIGTPCPWSPAAATTAIDATSPISAPGMRRSTRSLAITTAKTAAAMPTAHPLTWPNWSTTFSTRPDGGRAPAGEPEDGGQLADGDLDGDPGEDPGHDRCRQEVGDPSRVAAARRRSRGRRPSARAGPSGARTAASRRRRWPRHRRRGPGRWWSRRRPTSGGGVPSSANINDPATKA